VFGFAWEVDAGDKTSSWTAVCARAGRESYKDSIVGKSAGLFAYCPSGPKRSLASALIAVRGDDGVTERSAGDRYGPLAVSWR